MGIKLKFFVGAVFFLLQVEAKAQEKWNLKTCVEYAMENNLGAKQTQFQAGQVILNTRQNKLSRWPTLNGAINSAFNSGNNQDPTTFSRVTENYISAGFHMPL
jgi:outer membrane protein